ncbi:MAG: hypothetical protein R2794_05190 [Chitinophagales bacterium]
MANRNKEALLKYISDLNNQIESLGVKEEVTQSFPVKFLYFHGMERLYQSLNTIILILRGKPFDHGHALGLVMRNIISDFLILSYIYHKPKGEEERIDLAYDLYRSDIATNDRYIDYAYKNGMLNEELYNNYKNMHTADGSLIKLIKDSSSNMRFASMKDISEYFASQDESEIIASLVVKAYDYWALFSKNEHIGWNSYNFTRPVNNSMLVQWLYTVVDYIATLTLLCCDILEEKEKALSINESFKEFRKHSNVS